MKIHLITFGTKPPKWVQEGFETYRKRLPPHCKLELIELEIAKRNKSSNIDKLIEKEEKKLFEAIPTNNTIVALDRTGTQWDTTKLSIRLSEWLSSGQDVSLLVGGPDGLSKASLKKVHAIWSLSNLTFPHPLMRILLAEQIYRAWSLLQNHPYHK